LCIAPIVGERREDSHFAAVLLGLGGTPPRALVLLLDEFIQKKKLRGFSASAAGSWGRW
jgi:hypothetical protein